MQLTGPSGSAGSTSTWSNEEVDDAVAALQSLDTAVLAMQVQTQEFQTEMKAEMRVTDHLLVSLLFLLALWVGYVVSAHFALTKTQIVGD